VDKLIKIKVVTKAKEKSVTEFSGGLKARITAPPVDGKANKALIRLIAEYYGVKNARVSIVKGVSSKDKVIKVSGLKEVK